MNDTTREHGSNAARRRWGLPVPRRHIEREVRDELLFHLDRKTERLIERGYSPEQARAEAERRFGAVGLVEEQCVGLSMQRERRRMRLETFTDLVRDLRYAARALRRRPGFTATAVLTVALGLGAVTSIFTLLDAVMLRALPYPEPQRLAVIWGPYQSEAVYLGVSELDAFENVTAIARRPLTLTGDGQPLRVEGATVTEDFFDTLRLRPLLGRPFNSADAEPGAPKVAVVSERLARSRFGAAENALSRQLTLEGELYEIVGVASDRLRLPAADTELWLPMTRIERRDNGYHWGNYNLELLARLRPGVDNEAARLQVRSKAKQLRLENPIWTPSEDYGDSAAVTPLQATLAGDLQRVLQLMMAAALAVLLVACVNVANLLLARSSARQHETTVRASLGAGRGRLVLSLLLESLVIASLGAALGLATAFGSIRLLTAALPNADARFGAIGIDLRVLGFTLGATVVTALLFGLLPALRSSRVDLVSHLTSGARGGGTSTRRLSRSLVVVQLALSVMLLFSAGLMLKSLWKLWNEPPGFSPETVLLARIDPVSTDYDTPERRIDLYRQIVERLESSPMVRSAAASTLIPMGSRIQSVFDSPALDLDPNDLPVALNGMTTPGFFESVGIPLLRGRDFGPQETRRECTVEQPCATIVTQTLSERMFQGEAMGETIGIGFLGWFEIVGIAADARLEALSTEPTMAFFLPHSQSRGTPPLALELVIRADGDPMALESLVRETVQAVDPQIPVDNFRTLESMVRSSVSDTRFLAYLLAAFAALSVILGAIGVYGVISFMVEERRHEIGVRAALGATPEVLRRGIVVQASSLALLGILLGALGYLGVARLVEVQLYETTSTELEVLLAVPFVLFAATVVSSWIPARRAAKLDPVVALRQD